MMLVHKSTVLKKMNWDGQMKGLQRFKSPKAQDKNFQKVH